MKKTIFTIALTALMLVTTSGYNRDAIGTKVGDTAPSLKVSNQHSTFNLSEPQSDYVLLTFWSSADANSRIECNKYDAWMNANQPDGLKHIAINFDSQPELFAEIAKRDKLDEQAQFNVRGSEASQIISDFRLSEGFGSLLIGPDGRICEINPTTTDLSSLI